MLTPKQTYIKNANTLCHTNVETFNNSPTISISPNTKNWVSKLIELPNLSTLVKNSRILVSPEKLKIKNIKLNKTIKVMRRQLKQKNAIIQSLKKSNQNIKFNKVNVKTFFNNFKFFSDNSNALMSMQILHKNRKPWTDSEKNIALSIYYKSPSTYKYMRQNGIILPGESTVRNGLNSINYTTGFSKNYIEHIQLKTSEMMYSERKCVILLDEISIMKCIEYNKNLDIIEGFEDIGMLSQTE